MCCSAAELSFQDPTLLTQLWLTGQESGLSFSAAARFDFFQVTVVASG